MNELEKLQERVSTLETQLKELAEHCKTMFELQLENQTTQRETLKTVSNRLTYHIETYHQEEN